MLAHVSAKDSPGTINLHLPVTKTPVHLHDRHESHTHPTMHLEPNENDIDALLELAREEGLVQDYTMQAGHVLITFEGGRTAEVPQDEAVDYVAALLHRGERP